MFYRSHREPVKAWQSHLYNHYEIASPLVRNGIMEKQASFRGGHKVAHKAQTFCDLKGSKVVYNKYTGL